MNKTDAKTELEFLETSEEAQAAGLRRIKRRHITAPGEITLKDCWVEITLSLDAEVVEFFNSDERKINQVLREKIKESKSSVENSSEKLWKDFGKWYQSEREQAGKTQEDVAKSVDIHVKTVSRIENGEATKRATVVALAKAVNTDEAEALRRAGFAPISQPYPKVSAEIKNLRRELLNDEEFLHELKIKLAA